MALIPPLPRFFSKSNKSKDAKPEEKLSERDKQIIQHLFTEVLDLDMIHDTLKVQQTWYGYKRAAISNLLDFLEEADKLSNRVSNKIIRGKTEAFMKALEEFSSKCSMAVAGYRSKEWFLFIGRQEAKDHEEIQQGIAEAEAIDKIGLIAYDKLIELTDFLRQRDLL